MEQAKFYQIVGKNQRVDALAEEDNNKLQAMNQTLVAIQISGNSYSKDFCLQISEILAKCPNIQYLDFQNIFVQRLKDEIPQSLQYIGDSLIGKNVLEIDLSDNAVNPFGAKALSNYLSQATSLRKFVSNNGGIGPEGIEIIAQALEQGTPNLEVLALARNRAEDKGAIAIGKACIKLPNLKELHVYQDVIKKPGMQGLLEGLKNCQKLEVLDIRDNFLQGQSTDILASLIKSIPTLKSLNLSDCDIDENSKVIGALNESSHALEKICYNYNNLEDEEEAKEFLDAVLKDSSNLKKLEIKGNDFTGKVRKYYRETMKSKNVEEALGLFESDDEDEGEEVTQQFQDLSLDLANLKL